ncbi:MAG: uncharacterized protein JWL73_3223 [Actinomycetia bacterium]|nr:uncharacterized protein [Actinomycetes bacterium]
MSSGRNLAALPGKDLTKKALHQIARHEARAHRELSASELTRKAVKELAVHEVLGHRELTRKDLTRKAVRQAVKKAGRHEAQRLRRRRNRRDRRNPVASLLRSVAIGVLGGAAGTVALDVVTYTDMFGRGRDASSVPADLVGEAASRAGVESLEKQNQTEAARNRRTALGSLSGYAAGVGTGAVYGLARGLGLRLPTPVGASVLGLGAMAAADGPIAALGVSDPRTWSATDWASDVFPHLVYGAVAASVVAWLDRPDR